MSKLTLIAEPGTHEIVMTRAIAAPRDRVFRAYTDPEMVAQWWGPAEVATIIDTLEARRGGSWRYIHRGADGSEYAFSGVFHDVVPSERLIYTFEFEPMPGHVLLETITFEDQGDGTTKVIDASVFQSVADRDGMLSMGMEGGAAESMDRLEALLARG